LLYKPMLYKAVSTVSATVGLGHGVYRKLYTLIGGHRAEKFENHWFRATDR